MSPGCLLFHLCWFILCVVFHYAFVTFSRPWEFTGGREQKKNHTSPSLSRSGFFFSGVVGVDLCLSLAMRAHVSRPLWVIQHVAGPKPLPKDIGVSSFSSCSPLAHFHNIDYFSSIPVS